MGRSRFSEPDQRSADDKRFCGRKKGAMPVRLRFAVPAVTIASFVLACGGGSDSSSTENTGARLPSGSNSSASSSPSSGASTDTPSGASGSSGGSAGTGSTSSNTSPGDGTGDAGGPETEAGARNGGGARSDAGSNTDAAAAGGGPVGSAGPCGVTPVTPLASRQAQNLLCYLYSIKGNHVLSGQQEANWNANPTDISWYTTNIGKFPAILGSDFLYRGSASCSQVTASTERAIAYWNAGGITMFRYHMGLPAAGLTCTSDCYNGGADCAEPTTPPTAAFFTNVLTAGTAENTSLNAKLDYVAVQIGAMQAANVPVILAIYHETQPNGWFWWAENDSGPTFINLWIYTFNYLTETKGLTNIVWLMPFSGSPSAGYYPGNAYVDVGGPDEYVQPSNLPTFNASANYGPAENIFGNTMPITLHETGTAVQPDTMFPTVAPWVLFNVWATYENTVINGFTYNTVASLQSAYASQFIVTRDEVPNLN